MSYSPPNSAKPFTLAISDKDYSEFKQLLQLSKIGPVTWESQQEDRRYGVTHKWVTETKNYWLNQYDWRAQEKHINSFPNYTMSIKDGVGGDITVHFVGIFSKKKDAVPIVFMHGWPGSFIEFLPMCDLIREKYSADNLPYHIVVPSLPGYTLSSGGPPHSDWRMQDSARVINQVMQNLGFSKYIAQGGDVGSFLGRVLAQEYDSCVGVHLNMMSMKQPPEPNDSMSPLERGATERAAKWRQRGTAYAQEHATRPNTIGFALSSSPLALMAWIGEKLLEWSDSDPSLDTILTNVSLYWFTQGFPRSIYPYRELFSTSRPEFSYLTKPFGFSFFPHELMPGIKSAVEKEGNLVFYKQHEKGGHFAALERPKEILQDVEEFVKVAWKV
ncbi:epoxide hydrolase-like protein [Lindgomyces ingoldianus]|uniref:Epoxide hydrolase-like protein n=1 Tax=Lindgomyces ingoldianus TaxID=673940 RepID=A0ACB6QVQ9_9PLEO|nr:epoxide hydrolase-like protein [Lindgomyces ingoldianus]KAF2470951.1 epoxide hydrolase-like protein [Lindgomyces ingoldianus]